MIGVNSGIKVRENPLVSYSEEKSRSSKNIIHVKELAEELDKRLRPMIDGEYNI